MAYGTHKKYIYFDMFTDNIWPYLLRSAVIKCKRYPSFVPVAGRPMVARARVHGGEMTRV